MSLLLLLLLLLTSAATAISPRILPRVPDPSFDQPLSPSPRPPLVLVVTQFRSGSTYLGEIFNQNPDIFYEFETLHPLIVADALSKDQLEGVTARHDREETKILLLRQILANCSVPINCFREPLHQYWQCGASGAENLELIGQEECDESRKNGVDILAVRRHHCRTRSQGAVLKVIRLRRLRDLELLGSEGLERIRVIHLIRDPRAMLRSRSGFKDIFTTGPHQLDWTRQEWQEKLSLEMYSECARYRADMRWGMKWLGSDRYMAVTHDQMSLHPIATAYQIYAFLGLSLPEKVRSFLESREVGVDQMENREGSMNTKRESRVVLEKWLGWWVPSRVPLVERQCADIVDEWWSYRMDPEQVAGLSTGWDNH